MKQILVRLSLFSSLAAFANAHRLDEYLQATILSIGSHTVNGTLRLIPGVAVSSGVIASIDANHDGVITTEEQRRYAEEVLSDLRLQEDDRVLAMQLGATIFPALDQMKAGTGDIELSFTAGLPITRGHHRLTFENQHRRDVSVYLVNSLVPQDTALQLGAQVRNRNQSWYQLDFAQSDSAASKGGGFEWSGFGAAFKLGVRHITEGTDHLLFLLTLLLPAPLLAFAGKWRGQATINRSLLQILRIVTAFTLGHSVTLALAGFGLLRLPSRPVEVFIAVSILISALHARRPMFPGREAFIAASFGLIHGLAFASALSDLGVSGWYRLVSVLGFNVGIETMQIAVVAGTLPALILLSRTPVYSIFRSAGSAVAIIASLAWIFERTVDRPNMISESIERLASHGLLLVSALWLSTAMSWMLRYRSQLMWVGDE